MPAGLDSDILLGPLPAGRHRLGREVVEASQRARLLSAMTEVVTRQPYGEVTVADVVAQAGVSRRTFYEQFPSKLDCLVAAYEDGTDLLIRAIAAAVAGRQGWRDRLGAGIATYLANLGSSPGFARIFALEIATAGDAALEHRRRVHRRFVGLYRELNATARAEDPEVRTVADEELLLVVAGTEHLVAEHLHRQNPVELPVLAPVVVSVVSSLLLAS